MERTLGAKKTIYIVTMGLLSAVLLVGQVIMAALPNIEPVTFLIILYTLVYGKEVFFIIYSFVFLEGLIYGFGIWWVSYLYIWSILAVLVLLMRKNQSTILWAVVSGSFGLFFGALCAIPYLISGGIGAAFAYWSAGIPFDIIHCVSNFCIMFLLYKPMFAFLKKLHLSQMNAWKNYRT